MNFYNNSSNVEKIVVAISARIPEGMFQGTTGGTLEGILDGISGGLIKNTLREISKKKLHEELSKKCQIPS